MVGSNNATGVILGIYLISIVSITFSTNKKSIYYIRIKKSFLSKKIILKYINIILKYIIILSIISLLLINIFNLPLDKIRLFGFGSSTLRSLNTRIEILRESFIDQISYSPILGNMNVALETTGDKGNYIHSFLLYIQSNLGLIGLIFAILLFGFVFRNMYKIINHNRKNKTIEALITAYKLYILIYIFIFANVTVSISWSVIWFSLGLLWPPVIIKNKITYI
jgi:O-antigen ligase